MESKEKSIEDKLTGHVLLKVDATKSEAVHNALTNLISQDNNGKILNVFHVSGDWDYVVTVSTQDPLNTENSIMIAIKNIPGVKDTRTFDYNPKELKDYTQS